MDQSAQCLPDTVLLPKEAFIWAFELLYTEDEVDENAYCEASRAFASNSAATAEDFPDISPL